MKETKLSENEKIDVLKYNISRYDHYYASVNFKSSFLVLGNITILGFVLSSKTQINNYFFYALVLLIASSLISILLAIKPYLKKYNEKASIIFFNDISNSTYQEYQNKINKLSQKEYIEDLEKQTYILSKGLSKKFSYLNIATFTFIFTIILFFLSFGFLSNGEVI